MRLRDAIGYTALAALVVVGLYAFVTLPGTIPTSFGSDGRPQAWGPKATILLLPAIGLFAFAIASIAQATRPRATIPFRVPAEREAATQAALYAGTGDLKALLACGFLALTVVQVDSSRGNLSIAFFPVLIVFAIALLSFIASMFVRAWRAAYR